MGGPSSVMGVTRDNGAKSGTAFLSGLWLGLALALLLGGDSNILSSFGYIELDE